MQEADRKFAESKQSSVKLSIAIDRYFSQEVLPKPLGDQYEHYLKGRVRPLMERLILMEDICKMKQVAEQGWIGEQMIDGLVELAITKGKINALTFLMHYKENNFAFQDRDFTL